MGGAQSPARAPAPAGPDRPRPRNPLVEGGAGIFIAAVGEKIAGGADGSRSAAWACHGGDGTALSSDQMPLACSRPTLYPHPMALRSTDILTQTPQGLYCPLGDFHIDPVRPVQAGARSPTAIRTMPASGHRAVHGDPGDPAHHGRALRRGFRRLDPGGAAWARAMRVGDVTVRFTPGRPRARLGADRHRGRRHPGRGVGRLQARRGPDLPALRGRALRRVHHRGDLRPAGLPPSGHPRRGAQAPRFRRAVSRARPYRRRLCARQGAARHGAAARGRLRRADLSARRHGAPDRVLQVARASPWARRRRSWPPSARSLPAPS